eukprot:gnl/TRDRNA2_/TRDRNA2_177926_c0_seq2.p1 gnl/TRDRNA2_/TRDRNA2_177926_c0~~gnl/TRDRNA2_/TRDRNA2_177926_c0_seq2.p1  ORF type:complete len:417 (+),score=61.02 gnl/TRDRNA2_/TRDRNA2_177926_c0_seq2:72-1322(+)
MPAAALTLRINHTFLEFQDGRDLSLSPRASSDPGCSKSSHLSTQRDRDYLQGLISSWSSAYNNKNGSKPRNSQMPSDKVCGQGSLLTMSKGAVVVPAKTLQQDVSASEVSTSISWERRISSEVDTDSCSTTSASTHDRMSSPVKMPANDFALLQEDALVKKALGMVTIRLQKITEEAVEKTIQESKKRLSALLGEGLTFQGSHAPSAAEPFAGTHVPATVAPTAANEVVSHALLCAKLDGGMDKMKVIARVANPGSIAHPELCSRPCLYYAAGSCSNGDNCDYCHLPHPRRVMHLDKRHREMVKQLPFRECCSLVLPILKEKVANLGIDLGVIAGLDTLVETGASDGSWNYNPAPKLPSRHRISLNATLRSMSLRTLWNVLSRSATERERPHMDEMFTRLWQQSYLQEIKKIPSHC